ncbi:hypothetical protein G6O69_00690 [Pseudenhygromyxa sp. WMMC2535]|uniref:hypothetical protein n=1 Tax=Pseudenhygromyxa sp. WMMC2535 TaxID=2712867 RepID=UPI001555E486|nr:hypothetical protein [Pseudenhygromyxa sp. WMMC2535]NVB36326.1 hypothetical protein [Pseudenhygromyxa sp. WMMC2535]
MDPTFKIFGPILGQVDAFDGRLGLEGAARMDGLDSTVIARWVRERASGQNVRALPGRNASVFKMIQLLMSSSDAGLAIL